MEIPTDHLNKMSVAEFDTSKLLINAARQRDQRGLEDVLIVDVDCHHYENRIHEGNSRIYRRPGAAQNRAGLFRCRHWCK